jgi:HD-GYP domain-containing protein (c-di-GMP phosphodiesterase class II)
MTPKRILQYHNVAQQIPARQLSTLLKVSGALATSLDLPVVLQIAIDSAVEVLDLDTGAIYSLDGDLLYLGATTPTLKPDLEWMKSQPERSCDHPHLQMALTQHYPVFLNDAAQATLSPAEAVIVQVRHLRSVLYIPLLLEDKPIGALILGTTGQIHAFSDEEIDLSRVLAYQISLALANARLFRSMQQSHNDLSRAYDATLEGWSLALELRDADTLGHTRRVVQLTEDLALQLGVADEDLPHIRRGAMLHDIGKMGIPDAILHKPGPLNEDEWAIMRRHPEYAEQFLIQIDYLKPAVDIPYCHHEKWDGSGYPRGLHGEEIPLAARLFAVVDVYEALTSDRPYRKAWTHEAAILYIREQAGYYFDPTVVEAFLKVIR